MQPLEALLHGDEAEVARQLQICNACRYCEGFCAVFPAMTRRLEFAKADAHYLANLCHGCGACLHACQYAPPHEFAVSVPRAMARVRARTYVDYAGSPPRSLSERKGLTSRSRGGGMAITGVAAPALQDRRPFPRRQCYASSSTPSGLAFGIVFASRVALASA